MIIKIDEFNEYFSSVSYVETPSLGRRKRKDKIYFAKTKKANTYMLLLIN